MMCIGWGCHTYLLQVRLGGEMRGNRVDDGLDGKGADREPVAINTQRLTLSSKCVAGARWQRRWEKPPTFQSGCPSFPGWSPRQTSSRRSLDTQCGWSGATPESGRCRPSNPHEGSCMILFYCQLRWLTIDWLIDNRFEVTKHLHDNLLHVLGWRQASKNFPLHGVTVNVAIKAE